MKVTPRIFLLLYFEAGSIAYQKLNRMKILITAAIIFSSFVGCSQNLPELKIDDDWIESIQAMIPSSYDENQVPKKVLLLSLTTGYKHWVIPHYNILIKEIGKKNSFTVNITDEISCFDKDSLEKYDAIILNNTCSKRAYRHLFFDAMEEKTDSLERWKLAKKLEQNLIDYVHDGGGLVVLHGGLTTFNHSENFGEMIGGSFDYHPPQQSYNLSVIAPENKITEPLPHNFKLFGEAYFMNGVFNEKHFQPLLDMPTSDLTDLKSEPSSSSHPVAWVKRYGFGRVFVSAPTHNAQNFTKEGFIPFITNGIKYAIRNLEVDDRVPTTYNPKWKKVKLLFEDEGKGKWQDRWFLDGTKAKLINDEDGMLFEAGPDWKNDTSHAVLWSKEYFEGDILIEYDYTKTDNSSGGVTILYFHATGKGGEEFPKDVFEWRDKRKVPTMSTYFRNMNAYHISYAGFRSNEEGKYDYVRLRSYEGLYRLGGTQILPDNVHTDLFKKDITYTIQVARIGKRIIMRVVNALDPSEGDIYRWDASSKAIHDEGRIGLRHMYTRSARYKNFKVWSIE